MTFINRLYAYHTRKKKRHIKSEKMSSFLLELISWDCHYWANGPPSRVCFALKSHELVCLSSMGEWENCGHETTLFAFQGIIPHFSRWPSRVLRSTEGFRQRRFHCAESKAPLNCLNRLSQLLSSDDLDYET